MNAYELADYVADNGYIGTGTTHEVANMLRQQADRIAELEKLLEHSVGSDCREMRYIQEIENRDARIAELEKQLKHYKMAWNMAENTLEAQTKPLSDEEIKELINNFPIIFSPQDLLTFARAIEERHGIK